jgi:hypothetical protein
MKFAPLLQKNLFLAVLAAFLLAGCESLPWPGRGEQFHPLDNDVAAIAAPETPAALPPLSCRVWQGMAHFQRGWYEFTEARFQLGAGARVNVPLAKAKGAEMIAIQGFFDAEGQKLIFCPVVDGPPDQRVACMSLYALDDDLKAGIKRSFDVPDAIRGAEIACGYPGNS